MNINENMFSRQIEEAKKTSIVAIAEKLGFTIQQKGRWYVTQEHDSLTFFPESNSYCRFSTQETGDVINFTQNFGNMTFKEAIRFILEKPLDLDLSYERVQSRERLQKMQRKDEFALPEFNGNMKRVFAYLIQTRKIDSHIVREMASKGVIREDINHNAVFIGYDEQQVPKYACVSGTLSEVKYKGEVLHSDKRYGFQENNHSKEVLVFESPIDLLSAKSLFKRNNVENSVSYISLGGLSFKALDEFLRNNEEVDRITALFDNDEAGQEAYQKLENQYSERYKVKSLSSKYSKYKDINEAWCDSFSKMVVRTNEERALQREELRL